jgi:hypothetical protein
MEPPRREVTSPGARGAGAPHPPRPLRIEPLDAAASLDPPHRVTCAPRNRRGRRRRTPTQRSSAGLSAHRIDSRCRKTRPRPNAAFPLWRCRRSPFFSSSVSTGGRGISHSADTSAPGTQPFPRWHVGPHFLHSHVGFWCDFFFKHGTNVNIHKRPHTHHFEYMHTTVSQ